MDLSNASALVTGGASGLGRACAQALAERGARVVILDLPTSPGADVAKELSELGTGEGRGEGVTFVAGDVLDPAGVTEALAAAAAQAPLRVLVHCAGRGGTVRVVDRDGAPGDLELYETVVRVNLVGTFNVLRLAAASMVGNEPVDGERGVCVLTASVAAWEGQIGQTPYAGSKAGIVGTTIVAARDLASRQVRVCTIAPGVFDTPILARLSDEVKARLAAGIPHPSRLGRSDEFASLALHIVDNPMLNGETIRLDGALRMAAR